MSFGSTQVASCWRCYFYEHQIVCRPNTMQDIHAVSCVHMRIETIQRQSQWAQTWSGCRPIQIVKSVQARIQRVCLGWWQSPHHPILRLTILRSPNSRPLLFSFLPTSRPTTVPSRHAFKIPILWHVWGRVNQPQSLAPTEPPLRMCIAFRLIS
jgi:hypothetical protein